jgi:hypothetical protein
VVERVEVDDRTIRIVGDKATLEEAIAGDQNANPNVRSFVRKWRAREDSNYCLRFESAAEGVHSRNVYSRHRKRRNDWRLRFAGYTTAD